MSRENVEIVRRVYEAAARRDARTVLSLYDPEVELDSTRLDLPDGGGIFRGHEGVRRFFRAWHEAWDNIEYDYEELIEAGEDQVVAVVTRRGRGRSSGAEVAFRVALLWTLRDGKVVGLVWFPTREQALAAAGSGA